MLFEVSAYTVSKDNFNNTAPTKDYLISGEMMEIERVPNNRLYSIFGNNTQINTKATYCLYLKTTNPNLPQKTKVEWEMHNQKYSGEVRFTQPYSRIVKNIKAECYIQSDNE